MRNASDDRPVIFRHEPRLVPGLCRTNNTHIMPPMARSGSWLKGTGVLARYAENTASGPAAKGPGGALDRQDELAHCGAALEDPVRLRGLFQREDFGHTDLDGARGDQPGSF